MPVVKIDILKGHSKKEKEKLMESIFCAFEENDIPRSWVTIVIDDLPEENWAISGETLSKKIAREKKEK